MMNQRQRWNSKPVRWIFILIVSSSAYVNTFTAPVLPSRSIDSGSRNAHVVPARQSRCAYTRVQQALNDEEDLYQQDNWPFREFSRRDDYYVDDDFFRDDDSTARPIQLPRASRWVERETEEGFEDTMIVVDEEEENSASGNFWFNPKPGLDLDGPIPASDRSQKRRDSLPQSSAPPHSRTYSRGKTPSRTTFRSGTPVPPAPVRDFYNRLFWYGFDPADSSSPADPTMFGGTKGKFNGLAYLQDGVGVMPADELTRRPRADEESYWEEDEDLGIEFSNDRVDSDYEDEWPASASRATRETYVRRTPVTPPYDPPQPMRSAPTRIPFPATRSGRRPSRQVASNRKDNNDWATNKVSSWFQSDSQDEDNVFDDDEEFRDSNRRQRRRSRSPAPWSLFGVLETFLGTDRREADPRAEEYDRQMGIGRRTLRPPGSKRRSERRTGYAYRYEDDDGTPPVAEFEVLEGEAAPTDESPSLSEEAIEADLKEQAAAPGMSWEERALAVERVPPIGIPAWGPEGDLGMDARTKAILDATEDINLAKQRVEERRRDVEKAKEDIAILRVDAELERKRMESIEQRSRAVQARIRQVDLEIQDASRALRYAQNRLKASQDELASVEQRHWAVLSFYNPLKVEEAVQDAIRELEDNEPAARLYREKRVMAQKLQVPNSRSSGYSKDDQ